MTAKKSRNLADVCWLHDLPNGDISISAMQLRAFSWALDIIGLFALSFFAAVSSRADTNNWIKSTSGDWQEATSWSLGILPDISQSVAITNAGEKTITINSDTSQNYAAALTLNDLTITGTNTLLLDNAGTNVPLRIITDSNRVHEINGLLVGKGSTILNVESTLVVESGFIGVAGGRIIQSGGLFRAPNYAMFLYSGGSYYLTNGTFEGFWVDLVDSESFNLVGATVRFRTSLV
jgi:hypothetical protein